MNTGAVRVSPVNMDERVKLGLRAGDSVRVSQKIEEKGKTRLQVFEGLVLARKHGSEPGATFTVRKVTSGVGVEKIFPLYSPTIDKIEIIKRAKVRRAKLYYIRDKAAKEVRRQMRRMQLVSIATESETAQEAKRLKEAEEAQAADAAAQAAEEKATAEVAPEAVVLEAAIKEKPETEEPAPEEKTEDEKQKGEPKEEKIT